MAPLVKRVADPRTGPNLIDDRMRKKLVAVFCVDDDGSILCLKTKNPTTKKNKNGPLDSVILNKCCQID